jgi:hypothetical protein
MQNMKPLESGAIATKPNTASPSASPPIAVANSKLRIGGFGTEDSWETLALAKYRAYTTNGYAKRLYNSEPDLVLRRHAEFATGAQHHRSYTLPKLELQPWARVGCSLSFRVTLSQNGSGV